MNAPGRPTIVSEIQMQDRWNEIRVLTAAGVAATKTAERIAITIEHFILMIEVGNLKLRS